jgi:hypothetical protein
LKHDDRIDALQIACSYFQKQLAKDQDLAFRQRKEDLFNIEMDKYWGNQTDNSWIKL